MKIYAVTGCLISSGVAVQHWHFATTRAEAVAYIADCGDEGNELEVNEHDVEPTRQGIVDELNHFIDWTCINEG